MIARGGNSTMNEFLDLWVQVIPLEGRRGRSTYQLGLSELIEW